MTEVVLHQSQPQSDLALQMDYARAVSTASMLPENYRGKPADIMLAVGLGSAMGLSPAESLYRISVIKGKPTASAELIAANVRKAGHRLRVRGDDTTCTATIIRADDPDYEFTVVRDIKWAQSMGLASNDNYRKQPGTMLQWRAITAVARLACPEALYGVQYTPDEMGFDDRPAPTEGGAAGADRMRSMLGTDTVATPADDTTDPTPLNTSSALAKRMFALMGEAGITDRDDRLTYVTDVVGRQVNTSTEMTEDDARKVCAALEADAVDPTTEPGFGGGAA